jgi:4a-hydroxytetrahydrobiopterin dehydratase
MSEQGWRRFLAAEGVVDWVVLHGGATAVFRVASLIEAARLAEAVAQISELDGALMTLSDGQLTARLTRGVFRLEDRHVELARAVSAVGPGKTDQARPQPGARGATRHRGPARCDRRRLLRAVLGYAGLADDNAIDPLGHGSTVWMQNLDPREAGIAPPSTLD